MDTGKVRNASNRARVLSLDAPCRSRTANAFLLLQHTVLLFLLVFGLSSTSNTTTALAQSSKKAGQPHAKPAKSTRYCRLDFQVSGASCVSCIRRVAKRLKSGKGVLKADVSIYRPHWAVVIFESGKTDENELQKLIQKEKVKMVAVEKSDIDSVPAIVIPRSSNEKVPGHK